MDIYQADGVFMMGLGDGQNGKRKMMTERINNCGGKRIPGQGGSLMIPHH